MAYHPDGRSLLTAGLHELYVWDLATGTRTAEWPSLFGGIAGIEFLREGTAVIVRGQNGTIDLRRWPDGAVLQRHEPISGGLISTSDSGSFHDNINPRDLYHVAYNHDRRIAVANYEMAGSSMVITHQVVLWKFDPRPRRTNIWSHNQPVSGISLSPDGKLIASGSKDHSVIVGAADTGERLQTWNSGKQVNAVQFITNTRLLAAVGWSCMVFDTATSRVTARIRGHKKPVTAFAVSADLRTLLTASEDGTFGISDLAGGALHRQYEFVAATECQQVLAIAPDSCTAATIDQSGTVRIWDLDLPH